MNCHAARRKNTRIFRYGEEDYGRALKLYYYLLFPHELANEDGGKASNGLLCDHLAVISHKIYSRLGNVPSFLQKTIVKLAAEDPLQARWSPNVVLGSQLSQTIFGTRFVQAWLDTPEGPEHYVSSRATQDTQDTQDTER